MVHAPFLLLLLSLFHLSSSVLVEVIIELVYTCNIQHKNLTRQIFD